MIEKISSDKIPYDKLIRGLCCTPFYGHKSGCGNVGKYETCPPKLPFIEDIFDLTKDFFVVYTEFNVGEFAEKLKVKYTKDFRFREMQYPDNPKKGLEYVAKIKNKLRERHPDWKEEYFPEENKYPWASSRNCYNPRRWQEQARKEHRDKIKQFQEKFSKYLTTSSPEGMGVNVTGLMHELEIKLNWKWPPEHNIENKTYLVSLAGIPK